MSKTNSVIFKALHVVAWVIFVGLCIEAGGLIINFIFSLFKPELLGNLYQKLDLSELHERKPIAFFGVYSFVLCVAILKAHLFYIVISLMHKMDLSKPFSSYIEKQISQISYYTLAIGFLSHIARQFVNSLMKNGYLTDGLNQFWADSQAFILMGAVIYIIAVIFKRGIELQNEQDLTV
ncbi:DUF2975 domain-containing protein [Jiulongibacter sediminis]|jgi:hypothetical protein|uniref:DUF2975 domain-containing protein n=1 Tax=Jiulongibacter sediminis TaxID=1605367 RepID=UPI0026EC3390|nr:DUF2975 domain-containing protein [Jiulongibacter sediminis]